MPGLRWMSALFILLLLGCFPSKKAIYLQKESLPDEEMSISAPTKVFLSDNSLVLFPDGFAVKKHSVVGWGTRYQIDGSSKGRSFHNLPLENVIAITYYESESSHASSLGSFILGLHGSILVPLSLYCLSCPKCCFGSCPTVYINEGSEQVLQAELFSYCISKYQQETDLDLLYQQIENEQNLSIRITNEAMETHYIDLLNIQQVDHPLGTSIYPTPNGNYILTRNLHSPNRVVNSKSQDVLPLVRDKDNQCYRTDSSLFAANDDMNWRDHLDLKIHATETGQLNLVLKVRNSLLSTVLFYDLVLGSQGISALDWTEKINNDPCYALLFQTIYKSYSGITVKVNHLGKYHKRYAIGDVGPIAWKELAVSIPVNKGDINDNGELDLRLEFFPDHFMIDYIGYEMNSQDNIPFVVVNLTPESIKTYDGKPQPEILNKIGLADDNFLVTNPGESYYLNFHAAVPVDKQASIFIRSKGYYIE